jgi:general secretion pathway protein A
MAGQPEVTSLLNDESLRQLKQRVALRCELRPLTLQETAGYIAGRIRSAGGVGAQVFTREAVTLIHERSRGIPRTISVICDNALLTGFAIGQRPVNSTTIREVCRDFDLGRDNPPAEPPAHAPAAEPTAAAPANLLVVGPAGHTGMPVAGSSEPLNQPSDESLRELYGAPSRDVKRRTFSFLRG